MIVRPKPLVSRPRVSVVVPCYNYGRYLPQLASTLLAQQGVQVDVLIVDDASPDGSAAVAERIAASDSRVSVLKHAENAGHIRTYNDGLARATGDYVVLLSADDLLPPGALARAVSVMEANPRVGFVYGWAQSFVDGPRPPVPQEVRNWSVWPGTRWLERVCRQGRCFIASPEVVMRREAFDAAGEYDARLPHSADFDMWLRTAVDWDVGRVNGAVQALYRVHDANMHLTAFAGWGLDLRERRATFDILFDERAPERAEIQRLRPVAMKALARESLRRALAAHRDRRPDEEVSQYLDFAVETHPAITSSLMWKLCEAGPLRHRRLPAPALQRLWGRGWHHLQWRRERRYGW